MRKEKSPSKNTQISLFTAGKDAPEPFRKAIEVLHSVPKAPISLLQRKVANAWLKNALETTPDNEGWFELSRQDLNQIVGFDSKATNYMSEAVDRLMNIVFEWDVMAPVDKRADLKRSVLFPEVEIRGSTIRYQFSNEMRKVLLNPEVYALIDMSVVRRFRRAPSLTLWEFCIRYEKIGRTAEVEWEKLRSMILGDSSEAETYKEYKYFKAKVLKVGIAEINSESNHTIELLETRSGRTVRSLQFTVTRKVDKEPDEPIDDRVAELMGEVIKLGLPRSEAKKVCAKHSYEDVKRALDYTRQRASAKGMSKLDNPSAYFRHALSNNYSPTSQETSAAKPVVVDIKAKFLANQLEEAKRYFRELDEADQTSSIELYNQHQQVAAMKIKKKVSKATESAFYQWLASTTWGEPTSDDLLAFAQTMLMNGT